jgi:two-component system, NarL family, invasion response regulator UvrY
MSIKYKVVLVDDHTLFRKGISGLINDFSNFEVVWEAGNGKEFTKILKENQMPDIVLLDITMPEMDGYQTSLWIKKNHPDLKFVILSMCDNEAEIIKMLKAGARGYVLKDANPEFLEAALEEVMNKGFYYSEWLSGTIISSLRGNDGKKENEINDKENEFLRLACSELTYKEIADKMNLSVRTIDGYRDSLFEKLNIKSRVGLVLFAIKNGYAKV